MKYPTIANTLRFVKPLYIYIKLMKYMKDILKYTLTFWWPMPFLEYKSSILLY